MKKSQGSCQEWGGKWEEGRGTAGTGAHGPKSGFDEGRELRRPSSLGKSSLRLKSLAGFGPGKRREGAESLKGSAHLNTWSLELQAQCHRKDAK